MRIRERDRGDERSLTSPRKVAAVPAAGRVLLVVALAGLGALGLSGRRGLDWSALFETPDQGRARVVLVVLAAGVVAATAWYVLVVRRRRRRPKDEVELISPAVPLRWYVVVAAVVFVVTVTAALVLLARALLSRVLDTPEAEGAGDGEAEVATLDRLPLPDLPTLLVALTVLALGAALVARLRQATPALAESAVPQSAADPVVLDNALDAAEQALAAGDDVRAAVIAAYTAMAHSLAVGAAPPRPSDTPTEVLERAVQSGQVSRASAGALTELFREARFSSHSLPATARVDAETALARVREELGVRHG